MIPTSVTRCIRMSPSVLKVPINEDNAEMAEDRVCQRQFKDIYGSRSKGPCNGFQLPRPTWDPANFFFPEFANVLILAKEMANVYLDEVA